MRFASPVATDTTVEPAEADPPRRIACEIALQNPGRRQDVAARRLRPWLAALMTALAPAASSVGVRFVSDAEIRALNQTYRGRDTPTDVLSFPGDLADDMPRDGEPDACHLGDIVIGVPTARRQAQRQGHSIEVELRTLVLHGVLHCLGYDHETDDGTMERLEDALRARWIDGAGDA